MEKEPNIPNSIIKGEYEEFDPFLELKKIRRGAPEERKKRLAEYKEQLVKQKKGIAELQIDLEEQIRENPDLHPADLMKSVYQKASEYKLSARQLSVFNNILNKYHEQHQAVESNRSFYKDDKELFNACFGHYPQGKIEIIKGPITLYFRCHNIKDYAIIRSKKFKPADKLARRDIVIAKKSGGTTVINARIPELNGCITAENAEGRSFDEWSEKIIKHEEQHAIKRLFKEEKFRENRHDLFIEDLSKKENQKTLEDYFRFRKKQFEEKAKDEILAYLKEGVRDTNAILNTLFRLEEHEGLYDYYRKWHEKGGKEEKNKILTKLTKKRAIIDKIIINKTMNKILVQEYRKDLSRAMIAVRKLQDRGFSNEKIVKLLITEPLGNWPKLARRLEGK